MSATQLVSCNALFNCNAIATAHCRVNGADCSKQAYMTRKGFSPPKVNTSVFLHVELVSHLLQLGPPNPDGKFLTNSSVI